MAKKEPQASHNTPLPETPSWSEWMGRLKIRKAQWQETNPRRDSIEITFTAQALLGLIGDIHLGSPETNHTRLEDDLNAILETPGVWAIAMGDLVDGYFFNPAQMEEMEQPPAQFAAMRAILEELGSKGKLLAAFGGDHDGWAKKMGVNPYAEIAKLGAHYLEGESHITAHVGDQDYLITAAHRLPGHSMYNPTHPQMRSLHFGAGRDSDIIVSGHAHKKAHTEEVVPTPDGKGRRVDLISLGTYKQSDEYGRKQGWTKIPDEGVGASAILLDNKEKRVTYFGEIREAIKEANKRSRRKKRG